MIWLPTPPSRYPFEVLQHIFPTCGGMGTQCYRIAYALGDRTLFHDSSRPAAVPNELLLPIMEALKASGADATLARLTLASRASITINGRRRDGRSLEVWSRYMAGERREHAFVRKASVTAFLVRDVLEKLIKLERLDLNIQPGIVAPITWTRCGVDAENQPAFGCASLPSNLKTFRFTTSFFDAAPSTQILEALERHAETGALESWTYDGAMLDFALYPSAAQKLRELAPNPRDYDETARLCGAMGMNLAFWDLEQLHLTTSEGRLAEPFLPLIETRAPNLKRWRLTNTHSLMDMSRFPCAASLLEEVSVFTEQDCAALFRSPARPAKVVVRTLLFLESFRDRFASVGWIRKLELASALDEGIALSLHGVADLITGRLPPHLTQLEIEVTSERRGNGGFWFTKRLAKLMRDAGFNPGFGLWDRKSRSFAAVGGPDVYYEDLL
ncbi:hypothetical protein DFJ74DRAFT_708388 [Hyaloraphidium curvatum]|nr:hypothetical protein DFJ74DRAFT_708388 [Hyaloraphidium curvatum]